MMFVLGCLVGIAFGMLIGFVWAMRSMEEVMRQMWRGLRMIFALGCLVGIAFGMLIGFVWAMRSMEEVMRQMWRGLRMIEDDIADLQNHDQLVRKDVQQWFN